MKRKTTATAALARTILGEDISPDGWRAFKEAADAAADASEGAFDSGVELMDYIIANILQGNLQPVIQHRAIFGSS